MEEITSLTVKDLVPSGFYIVCSKRRAGKTVLVASLIREMIKAKMVNILFLFSPTDSGFEMIPKENRFKTMEKLDLILKNFEYFNEFNKLQTNKNGYVSIKCTIVIDDMAVELKKHHILEKIAMNGRHLAKYGDMDLTFFILSQSLTKISRTCRLQADIMFIAQQSSLKEKMMIFDEYLYLLSSNMEEKRYANKLYDALMVKEPFIFLAILNYKQNVTKYSDYLKYYVGSI